MTATPLQQAPVRNESVVGAHVYSHSGEFSPRVTDIALPGRGVSFQFVRKYRSGLGLHDAMGPLGRGWTFTYAKRLEREGDGLRYHDGLGRAHRFTKQTGADGFVSPAGFYASLTEAGATLQLTQRYGTVFAFAQPEDGGRLLAIKDRNGNALSFAHSGEAIQVADPFGRHMAIIYEQTRVVRLEDDAGRVWHYHYDQAGRLIEVVQPPTDEAPDGPRITYGYDEAHRLISITDPNRQTYLRNTYDAQGRITLQEHGSGSFEFRYEPTGATDDGAAIFRTHVRQKNGARLVLEHDADGHLVERTLFVTAEAFAEEDRAGANEESIPLTTRSRFNRHGEVVERRSPAGDTTEWQYDEDQADPRARGNPLFAGNRAWDSDSGLLFGLGAAYDPATSQFVNPEGGAGETGCGDGDGDMGSLPRLIGGRNPNVSAERGEGVGNIGTGLGLVFGAALVLLTAPVSGAAVVVAGAAVFVGGFVTGVGIEQERERSPKGEVAVTVAAVAAQRVSTRRTRATERAILTPAPVAAVATATARAVIPVVAMAAAMMAPAAGTTATTAPAARPVAAVVMAAVAATPAAAAVPRPATPPATVAPATAGLG